MIQPNKDKPPVKVVTQQHAWPRLYRMEPHMIVRNGLASKLPSSVSSLRLRKAFGGWLAVAKKARAVRTAAAAARAGAEAPSALWRMAAATHAFLDDDDEDAMILNGDMCPSCEPSPSEVVTSVGASRVYGQSPEARSAKARMRRSDGPVAVTNTEPDADVAPLLFPSREQAAQRSMLGSVLDDDDAAWNKWQLRELSVGWTDSMVQSRMYDGEASRMVCDALGLAVDMPHPGDLCVAVEHCHHCSMHQGSTSHDQSTYMHKYDALVKRLEQQLSPDEASTPGRLVCIRMPTHLGKRHDTPDGPCGSWWRGGLRIGAFEVLFATRSSRGIDVQCMHSKLLSDTWPAVSITSALPLSLSLSLSLPGLTPLT